MAKAAAPALLQGTLYLLILHALQRGQMHGYAIAQSIHLLSDEELKVEGPAFGEAIGSEAGHDHEARDQCADHLEADAQAATNQTWLSLTRKHHFSSLPPARHHGRFPA